MDLFTHQALSYVKLSNSEHIQPDIWMQAQRWILFWEAELRSKAKQTRTEVALILRVTVVFTVWFHLLYQLGFCILCCCLAFLFLDHPLAARKYLIKPAGCSIWTQFLKYFWGHILLQTFIVEIHISPVAKRWLKRTSITVPVLERSIYMTFSYYNNKNYI